VPGGAANVQDIYPLAPLQEGILFHHLLETEGDVYLTTRLLTVESRQHLNRYLAAMQRVIERHDILRTGVAWKGLPEPVQVVWRHAPLSVEEMSFDPAKGDITEQLRASFDSRHYRLDVRRAPLFRLVITDDPANHRWLILELMHHLIGDQMTLLVMQQEIQAIIGGEEKLLPAPMPFRNFVVHARRGVSREEHEAFFTRMLKDVDEPTAPFGLSDAQGDGSRIMEMRREIDSDLSQRLRGEARRLGVTLASLCHVAWALVLASVSGRDDVVFGTVMFGRMQSSEGSDRGLGLFINTLPVRIRVEDESAAASVRNTHDLLTQLLRHEHASLGLAQRCSGVHPPVPLFTSLLNYRHVGTADAVTGREAADLPSEGSNSGTALSVQLLGEWERTNFPFNLFLNDMGHELSMDVQVDSSIRPQRVCALMQTALEGLVEALQNAPETALASLSVLPEEERQQVLYRWNATQAEYPQEKCLHELFEAQVKRTPDATALVFENESLSYAELNRRANRLAHCLRQIGVKADERVGVCAERGIEMVVALYAVLKAGGAYVPLNPDYPEDRLQYMLKNSSPVAVLTQEHLMERMKETCAASGLEQPVIDLKAATLLWQEQAAHNLECQEIGLSPDHLAYVIYTSGSTGTPKGVMIEHKSIVNRLAWMQSAYELNADDAVLQKTHFSFDVSVWEFFWPQLTGARLVIARPGGHKDPRYLCEAIEENRITTVHFVPSMLHAFLEYGAPGNCPSIRNIICSGEALSPAVARRCREVLPGAALHNLYGPTEAAVDVTAWTYPAHPAIVATIPIGRPIANTQIYVLNSTLEPVPIGVAGELYIGGIQVGRGYLNRDELTMERFIKDPFVKNPGARMYRTGDLGRWLEDGNIEYLGRNDFQVKVRGFRIELGEIESRLLEIEGVREAVVVAREDRLGEQQLVAYYVAHDQAKPDVEQLRRHLAARLPEYMVPAAYVSLENLPLTSSGKLDRKALPATDTSAYITRGYESPVGEVENTVASIWADVLKLERVGRNDNFFELGGHSLLAVTVIERLREAGLTLDVRALFASPTLKGLAEAAGGELRTIAVPPNLIPAGCTEIAPAMLPLISLSQSDIEKIAATVAGGAANIQDIYPLAPLQEGILFHHRLTREGDVYLTGTLLAIDSREDLDRHVKAIQTVIERHDILRTAVVWEGLPEPAQVVWRKAQIKVEHATFDPATGEIAHQLLARFSPRHYRLDVRQAPLWRLFIAEDAPNHRWVVLDLMHHMVVDHVTLEILQQEIQAIARGKAEQLLPPLPFRNFVAQTRLGTSREEHEAFFTRMLGDVDEPTAPFGLTNVQGDGSATKECHRTVDLELFLRLRAQARAIGVSVASTCHLAWALVLARTSGRDDVVFGTVMFGRMHAGEGSDRALGIFINTLPLRIKLGDEDVQASVRSTHALLSQLLRHEHASLGLAQRASLLRPPAPLFTSILNYRHTLAEGGGSETGSPATETWAGWKVLGVEDRNNYPFALSINDFNQGLSFDIKVDGSIDPQQVSDLMHTALESLTGALESNPAAAVRTLEVLPAVARAQLVYGLNQTETEYSENACIQLLFERQVDKTPELRAVASHGASLSYRELNRRANQLGRYLRNLGVGPDVRVGVSMKRGVEMIVGVLGIMKAGGAYVPLDPEYPEERLRYMMEDAGILIVVTQQEVEAKLRSSGIWLVCVDDPEEMVRIAQESQENAEAVTAMENLVYVIYTSGSTGKSKGVGIEHRQLANYVNGVMKDLKGMGLSEGAKYATVSTLSADLGNTVIYPSLVSGGELHVIDEDHVMDGHRLGEYFEREQIDCLKIVPSHLQGLRRAKGGEKVMPRKVLVVGGEASTRQWLEKCTANSECLVMNHYGPTETTVGVLRYPVQRGPVEQAGETVPIGQPLGNAQAYVVNKEMKPVPIGVAGELYIGGAGVGRGYVNRADLTAERFVPDPFSGSGQRLYKTGDLVRRHKDGNIEFLGRTDHQVKIRGFRIELGEIEAALRQQPQIEHAVVVVVESEDGNKRLVAYVTANGSGQARAAGAGAIDIESLRTQLGLLLPDYMVPAAYVVLDQLPLTANGKVDRKALPSPDSGVYVTRDYEAPVGEVETALARIWEEVLKVDRVGRNDNFFELGGHSLLAITVIERMREAGLILEVGALFDFPILKGLAETVGGEDRTVQAPPNLIPAGCTAITPDMLPLISLSQREIDEIVATVPGGPTNVQDIYPLAPLQEGILFHHLLTSDGDIYLNQTILGGSRERLDRYIKALKVVIHRHDILRTAVVWEGLPEPAQVVWRNAPLSVEEISLNPAAGDIVEQLRERFNPQHYRLDVRQAPLWRLIIAQDMPNNRWVMLELAHHLVADNTSIRFLLREIEMILQGQAELLPAPLPFRNFVAQARLGVSRQEHEAFFTRMLGDVDEPTAPFGLTNVEGDVSRILEGHRSVDPEVCRRLRAQARALGVSAASLCHLAWALVLARTSGRQDVVFGTVMFGRMQGGEGSDRVMGIFINTLPLRIRVGDEDVQTSVRKTHELQTQLFRHEHASLALVQRCSAVAAPAPLFTSILNYRHLREEAISAEKGAEAMVDLKYLGGQERNNYPFALAINDLGEAMTLDVKVDQSIDPQQVCAWMHTAMESLAEALESAPTMPVRRLEVLPAAEREQLVYGWNRTEVEYAPAESIHRIFEKQAERTPELRAVVSQGSALSYQELNQRANQLAHYLRKQGVRREDRVGIFMKRDVEMVVGLLAILKAGGAYVGLDTTYPEERLRYMVADAEARVVLTQQNLAERLSGSGAQLICLDQPEETARIAKESARNPEPVAALENLVYVIYTSGSTGKPKGVGIEHRQLLNYVRGITGDLEKLGVGVGSKYATVSTLAADLGNTAIYPSLLSGGELHVIHEDHVMDGQRLGEYFEREKIDCLKIVPSHLEGLRAARGGEKIMPRKVLVSGGEALPWKWARDWQRPSECAVINHYGPTETTVGAVRFHIAHGEIEEGTVPIGQPLANVQLYVLDQGMELVPSGAFGELYIGGAGVGRGYVTRPELTAERFVPDPFFGSGQRLYKTGDLVRRNQDGNIEFLGRVDQQIKIRGFRIELGEIEAAIRQQPGLAQAAVAATDGENGSRRLVAYFVPSDSAENGNPSGPIDVELLRVRLSSILPDYMVPAAYVSLKELPLNANGKLDRKRLPAPDADAYLTREYEAPVGEVEIAAAAIWADVLKRERVGRNDNFFELGGHSLLALSAIERMREAGFKVDVRDLFASPTLKGLVEAAGKESRVIAVPPNLIPAGCERITPDLLPLISLSQGEIEKIVETVPGGAANVQDIYPLAPLQEGILFHHLLETEGDVYLSATLLGAQNRERLDRYVAALETVVARHDILRTAIVWEGLPEPVQVVWRHAPLIVEEVSLDPAKGDIAEQLRASFDPRHNRLDIRQAPLWRLYIAHDVPNQRWVILELKHHLTGDNTTARFLLNEVRAILHDEAQSLPEPLPFRNFVAQARLGVNREEHEAFFTRMLKDVDEPTVPFGLANVQGDGSRIAEASRNIDPGLSVKLRTLARSLGVTVASMCHLAWATVLARTSGRDDVVFGTVLFGRMQGGEGADRGLGIFINTLPIRICIGNESVATSVRKTHQLLTDLFRHEHASLALVQRCSSVQAPAPLFTSLLNYRHVREEAASTETAQRMANLEFIEGHGRTNYPFGVYINDLGQDLSIDVQVETSIAPQRVCAMMLTALQSLAKALENAPETAVETLQVLPEEERRQVLYSWNATKTEYPKDKFLHELFEEQVERTPYATAVVLENQSLTYDELNQNANRLAHYLRTLGVKPDARVGICVERGIDTIVALLAVLKAEGAYVPLDPGYPAERLRFMLKDSAPMAVLTHYHLRELVVDIAGDLPMVDLNGNGEEWSDQPSTNPQRSDGGLRVENLAYVIYTSGSTGVPKGVTLEHRNAVNYVCWARQNLAASTLEQTLFSTSLNFDLAVFECFAPLTTGGSIRIVANVMELENRPLDVTLVATVPSAMRALVESDHLPSSVRAVVLGGELLKRSLVEKIFATTQVENVCNIYGPTETTTNSTWMETKRGEPYGQHIGRPVANTQVYILDPRMEPVPIGVVGEIYIAGAGVTRGYLNRPQLTAERFLKDPFAGRVDARMYRTGDLGRWLEDGNIEYRGRNDFQVKVRGVRIELGEIEARLLEHTAVREAIVMAREDKHGEQHLVAYYTPSPGATPDAEELRKDLAEKLTEHMVPRVYVSLDRLPLTASGKLDRKALPAPEMEAYARRQYEPPEGEMEEVLATIWAEILKLERVGRNDNFFDAGGHSLLAIQLGNRIRSTLGVALELRDIFAASTLKDMATVLSALVGVQDLLPDASQARVAAGSEGRYL
jgi:amino acid adenylation domain-containing protein